jgi:hypothetical protein
MPSDTQIDHYRTFGFIVLPAFLGDLTQPLADEVNARSLTPTRPRMTSATPTESAVITCPWRPG